MSHWRRRKTKGAEFWITCQQLAFLTSFSRLQVIQKKWCSAVAYVTAGYRFKLAWNTHRASFMHLIENFRYFLNEHYFATSIFQILGFLSCNAIKVNMRFFLDFQGTYYQTMNFTDITCILSKITIFPHRRSSLELYPHSNNTCILIIPSYLDYLCTVTFGLMEIDKNTRRSCMRKYCSLLPQNGI